MVRSDGPRLLAIACLMITSLTAVQASEWTFDATQLGSNVNADTVAMFNAGGQLPGVYHVGIYLNGEQVDETDIEFRKADADPGVGLAPCLNVDSLAGWGIRLPDEDAPSTTDGCFPLTSIAQTARAEFDFSGQRLKLSIPQAALEERRAGQVPQSLWNDGVPAFLLGYQGDVNKIIPRGSSANEQLSRFVRLTPGLNIGAWRLRNATGWEKEHGRSGRWESGYTRLERGLYGLKSRLTLGESSTPGDIFESVPFRGVMMSTDDAMSAPGESSFTPVIRGIAQTPARVIVRQNEETLYIRSIPPGPFALDNIPVPGAGGALDVSVEESNGDVQHFTVPWQTPAVALHEGYSRYSLMAGRYRMDGLSDVSVGQFTIMSGLPGGVTLYGGLQQSGGYRSIAAGAGMSLGAAGSLSADVTRSARSREQGNAMRLRYSKSLGATGTQISLGLTRYSKAYHSLSESISNRDNDGSEEGGHENAELSLTQPFGRAGNLSLSATAYKTTDRRHKTRNSVISYSVVLSGITLTLNWARNDLFRSKNWKTDRKMTLGVSIPLTKGPGGTANAIIQSSHSNAQGDSGLATLSGQSVDGGMSWGITGSMNRPHAPQLNSHATTLTAGWRSPYGRISGHYGQNTWSRQAGAGINGGLVLTQEGVASGQNVDGTLSLVNTPGVSGIGVSGRPQLKTNVFGQVLLSATPYRKNRVILDPLSLPQDAELQQSEVQVVPTQGAVVPAAFNVRSGVRGVITFRHASGSPVPFGAVVTQHGADETAAGIVGENGVAYLTGLSNEGMLNVRWGRSDRQTCVAPWHRPESSDATGLYQLDVTCR